MKRVTNLKSASERDLALEHEVLRLCIAELIEFADLSYPSTK